MRVDWTLVEEQAIRDLFNPSSVLRVALEKYCRARAAHCEQMCASEMRSVPRKVESAADYAAKAEAFGTLLTLLEREIEKSSGGPTA